MELLLSRVIEALLLPPGSTLALLLLGVIVRQRFYRTGQTCMYGGIALLVIFSIPLVASQLIRYYETIPALDTAQLANTQAQAIVLLGGGRYTNAPEYQADTVNRHALERARYTAWLYQKTGLPVLVTGGSVYGGEARSEAELLKQVLEGSFLSVVRWVEDESRTTYENAQFSRAMLAEGKVQHILLVTHALHMPRAVEAFEQAGFTVTPAPLGFHTPSSRPWFLELLPSAGALQNSAQFMHEVLGRAWYRLRYYAWSGGG